MKRMMMIDRRVATTLLLPTTPSLFFSSSHLHARFSSLCMDSQSQTFPDPPHRWCSFEAWWNQRALSYSSFAFRARSIRFLWPTHHA